MRTWIITLTILSALGLSHGQGAQNSGPPRPNKLSQVKRDYYAHIKPAHKAVLNTWLQKYKPWLRPAVEDIDSKYKDNPEKIKRVIGENAYQFYAFGDFNGDGKEDFAVILVDDREDYTEICKRDECSAFVIFSGNSSVNLTPAFYEEELDMIEYGYIAYDQKVKRRLYFGALEGYYFCSTLIPKGNRYEQHEDDGNCGYREPQPKQ